MKILLYAIIAVIVLAAVALFSAQNATHVTVWFYNWQFSTSLAIVLFLSFIAGAVITTLSFLSVQLVKSVRRRGRTAAPKQEQTAPPS